MILFLLISCFLHRANLVGIVDFTEGTECALELRDGSIVVVTSSLCKSLKEGDQVQFYIRKNKVKQ